MNSIIDFSRSTISSVLSSKRVWAIHLGMNALLIISFFYWTRIPEETGWEFTFTVLSGLIIAFLTLWLHCATFDYFRPSSEKVFRISLTRSLSRIPAFLLWVLIFGFGLWMIGQVFVYEEQIGGWARHMLPLFLRRQVSPRTMFALSHGLIWFLYFFLWPILFLPVGAQVAIRNFGGFFNGTVFRPIARLSFWIAYTVCFVVGAYVPYTLAWMVPTQPSPLNQQEWSMVLRLGSGYLLLVTAWIVLCAVIMIASDGEDRVVTARSAVAPEPVHP
jgi:hypothetical protein